MADKSQKKDKMLESLRNHFQDDFYYKLLCIEVIDDSKDTVLEPEVLNNILDKVAELVKDNGRNISNSQLHAICSLVNRFEPSEKNLPRLILTRPKLDSIAGQFKGKNSYSSVFPILISDLIRNAETAQHMKSIQELSKAFIGFSRRYFNKKS